MGVSGRVFLLVPAYPGSPGPKVIKRLCVFHMLNVSANWVSQNLSAHDCHQRVASSQELLGSHTSDKELFCCQLVTGDRTLIYHWDPLNKKEFMQWKDVDRPTFTRICKSAINWLDYGNSFSGTYTDCILERQLLVSIMRN